MVDTVGAHVGATVGPRVSRLLGVAVCWTVGSTDGAPVGRWVIATEEDCPAEGAAEGTPVLVTTVKGATVTVDTSEGAIVMEAVGSLLGSVVGSSLGIQEGDTDEGSVLGSILDLAVGDADEATATVGTELCSMEGPGVGGSLGVSLGITLGVTEVGPRLG